jgi:hypothetical protein
MQLTTEGSYRAVEAITRARHPSEIIDAVLECLVLAKPPAILNGTSRRPLRPP